MAELAGLFLQKVAEVTKNILLPFVLIAIFCSVALSAGLVDGAIFIGTTLRMLADDSTTRSNERSVDGRAVFRKLLGLWQSFNQNKPMSRGSDSSARNLKNTGIAN